MKQTTVRTAAASPKTGMTFRELEAWMRFVLDTGGVCADEPVKVRINFRGGIQSIQINTQHD